MHDHEKFALVLRPSGTVAKVEASAKRVLSGMVSDALTLARVKESGLRAKKFLVGDVELHELDYLQLLDWADQLKLTSLEVLRRLKSGLAFEGDETAMENGSFTKLHWDPGLLPLSDFRISQKLRLERLSFTPIENVADSGAKDAGVSPTDNLPLGYDIKARILNISTAALPGLKRLDCDCVGLESLTAGQTASLEVLNCCGNQLQLLDLKPFPNLRKLNCLSNNFTELHLAHVPELLDLDCGTNRISRLDLSATPKLQRLNCSFNDLHELILPYLPSLVELECGNPDSNWGQPLERIDLRGAPNLQRLDCHGNCMESLDLSSVSKLRFLDCSRNLLTELDLTTVPLLETLKCGPCLKLPFMRWNPPWIAELDIRELRYLKELDCDKRTRLVQRSDQHFIGTDYCFD